MLLGEGYKCTSESMHLRSQSSVCMNQLDFSSRQVLSICYHTSIIYEYGLVPRPALCILCLDLHSQRIHRIGSLRIEKDLIANITWMILNKCEVDICGWFCLTTIFFTSCTLGNGVHSIWRTFSTSVMKHTTSLGLQPVHLQLPVGSSKQDNTTHSCPPQVLATF